MTAHRGPGFDLRSRRGKRRSLKMIDDLCYPLVGAFQAPGGRGERTYLSDIPQDGQGEAAELVPYLFVDIDPDAPGTHVVSLAIHDARQKAHNGIGDIRIVLRTDYSLGFFNGFDQCGLGGELPGRAQLGPLIEAVERGRKR